MKEEDGRKQINKYNRKYHHRCTKAVETRDAHCNARAGYVRYTAAAAAAQQIARILRISIVRCLVLVARVQDHKILIKVKLTKA